MIDRPDEEAAAHVIEGIRRSRLRILVVDDDAIFRQAVTMHLTIAYRAAVSQAASVPSALAAVSGEARFDLILLDVTMPLMNGIEAYERIRAMGIDTPIVLMSAHSDVDLQSKAAEMAVPLLAKPLDRRVLEPVLHSCGGGTSL